MATDHPSQFKQAMDSSFWKLMQPILLGLLCYIGSQIMTRLDRLEQANSAAQIMLATGGSDVRDLKEAKNAHEIELQGIRNQVTDMVSRIAVLESRGSRK